MKFLEWLLFVFGFMMFFVVNTAHANYEWSFDSDTEGWTALHGSISSGSGNLYLSTNEEDPGVKSPNFSLKASDHGLLLIHISSNCPDTNGMVYFTTSSSGSYDNDKKVPFTVSYGSGWHTYTVDVSKFTLERLYYWNQN